MYRKEISTNAEPEIPSNCYCLLSKVARLVHSFMHVIIFLFYKASVASRHLACSLHCSKLQ